jgi:hypothetical protein
MENLSFDEDLGTRGEQLRRSLRTRTELEDATGIHAQMALGAVQLRTPR